MSFHTVQTTADTAASFNTVETTLGTYVPFKGVASEPFPYITFKSGYIFSSRVLSGKKRKICPHCFSVEMMAFSFS